MMVTMWKWQALSFIILSCYSWVVVSRATEIAKLVCSSSAYVHGVCLPVTFYATLKGIPLLNWFLYWNLQDEKDLYKWGVIVRVIMFPLYTNLFLPKVKSIILLLKALVELWWCSFVHFHSISPYLQVRLFKYVMKKKN